MKKVVVPLALALSLSACWQNSYEFEGQYFFAEGDECLPSSNPRDAEIPFLEIIPQGKGADKKYLAKLPLATALGIPGTSDGESSPTDNNELNFSFSKEGKDGFFGTPSADMSVSVIPHETKKNYIWLTKLDLTVGNNGKVINRNLLLPEAKRIGSKGMCLSKKT
jgi:hypothetical protein